MKSIINKTEKLFSGLKDAVLLLIRIVLAYGFYNPAKMKLGNLSSVAEWFDSMGYPVPYVSAVLAVGTESLGVILLAIGLGARIISIPLIFVMLVAIFAVHIGNGFNAGDNGFEIPLYYLAFLLVILSHGGGKYSVDYLLKK